MKVAFAICKNHGACTACFGLAKINSLVKALVITGTYGYDNKPKMYALGLSNKERIELTRDLSDPSVWLEIADKYRYDPFECLLAESGLATFPIMGCHLDKTENGLTVSEIHQDSWTQERFDGSFPPPRKSIGRKTRQIVYEKCGGHCAYCGKPLTMEEMQVDHLLSHEGHCGKDEIGNYLPSCPLCNRCKGSFTLDKFRTYIESDAPRIHFKKNRRWYADADKIVDAYHLGEKGNKVIFYFEKERKAEK